MKKVALHLVSVSMIFVLFSSLVLAISTGGSMPENSLHILIAMERMEYSIQDRYVLTILLENEGPDVIEIPDPFYEHDKHFWYHIDGPAYAGMTNRDYMTEGREYFRMRPMRSNFEERRLSLKSGEKVKGDIPLERAIGNNDPGGYYVIVELEWGGQTIRSNKLRFVLHEEKQDY